MAGLVHDLVIPEPVLPLCGPGIIVMQRMQGVCVCVCACVRVEGGAEHYIIMWDMHPVMHDGHSSRWVNTEGLAAAYLQFGGPSIGSMFCELGGGWRSSIDRNCCCRCGVSGTPMTALLKTVQTGAEGAEAARAAVRRCLMTVLHAYGHMILVRLLRAARQHYTFCLCNKHLATA
jgi:hypothetical protein